MQLKNSLIFSFSLIAALLIYLPGISGPFLLDDFHNLAPLASNGGITDWYSFKQFVFGGSSGPLGRPVALFTFTLNDYTWPSAAESFKLSNIFFHLLTGVALYIFLSQLKDKAKIISIPSSTILLCFSIWLLHPLNLTTVLYVIQRMTELSTLFSLLALSCYILAKKNSSDNKKLLISLSGFGVFSLLGIFSKENSINILLYALILDVTLLKNMNASKNWKYIQLFIIVIPLLYIVYHFISTFPGLLRTYDSRTFTLSERLLTEPRVLFYSLSQLYLPTLTGYGVFHDDITISKSIFTPTSSFLSILGLLCLLIISIYTNKKQPVISFAILWFLGGHILESSFIPLEIYYEHRNYMPIIGPIFAFCYYLNKFSKKYFISISFLIGLYLGFITYQNALVWGNEPLFYSVNAIEHPKSFRAQTGYANNVVSKKSYEDISDYYAKLNSVFNNNFAIHLQQLTVACFSGKDSKKQVDDILILKNKRINFNDGILFKKWATHVSEKQCIYAKRKSIYDIGYNLLEHAESHQSHTIGLGRIHLTLSEAYVRDGNLNKAIYHLDEAYKLRAEINLAKTGAILMASAGLYDEAKAYLNKAKERNNRLKKRRPSRMPEIKELETKIKLIRSLTNEK